MMTVFGIVPQGTHRPDRGPAGATWPHGKPDVPDTGARRPSRRRGPPDGRGTRYCAERGGRMGESGGRGGAGPAAARVCATLDKGDAPLAFKNS